jgi:DNA-binding NarL/FixJ family response regulator
LRCAARLSIRTLLSRWEDIKVVGEAATFQEVIQKTAALMPDVIVLDLRMSEGVVVTLPSSPKVLAISFVNDEEAKELADDIGAARLLDKMELSKTLVPAILELAPLRSRAC